MAERLKLTGIGKHFGAIRALDNVSLSIGKGEVLGLMGDNGAGKSTFIKPLLDDSSLPTPAKGSEGPSEP